MDSAQELYNKGLNQGWNQITVQDSDDLPESIKGDTLWINPSLSRNRHNIPASYHALHEGDYYLIEFINGNWYWLDWDYDQYLGYWSELKKKIPHRDKGLEWLERESECPTLMPGGSFTTLRNRAESSSTQDQEVPVVPAEDDDFIDTNLAQSEALAQEFDNKLMFRDIAEVVDPPQDKTHYLPTTLRSGTKLNPVTVNPIQVHSTTTGRPTALEVPDAAAAAADAAKLIANSIKVDGQLKGQVPDTFDGDQIKTQKFMNSFNLFWMTNKDSSAMKVTYRWYIFFLELLQGPKVDDWVLNQAVKLRTQVIARTPKTDETLWAQLKKDFKNAFAHIGRVEQARMELQKHRMDGDLIDEYIAKFETLLSKGDIPRTKVGAIEKFKDGLKPRVFKGILIRDTWPTNIDEWEEVARCKVHHFGIMKEALGRQGQSFGKPSKWQADTYKFLSKKKNELVPIEVDATTTHKKKPFKQGFNNNLKKERWCF